MPKTCDLLGRFRRDAGASAAVLFSLALVPVLGLTGAAVDYSNYERARSHLQDAVDSAALAAARATGGDFSEPMLATIEETARVYVRQNNHDGEEEVAVAIDPAERAVTVTATLHLKTLIAHFIGVDEFVFGAEATARLDGASDPICILALDPTLKKAIEFNGPSEVRAPNCAIHANSVADNALFKRGPGTVEAASVCAVGGHDGEFAPVPTGHCRAVLDPFPWLEIPEAKGTCDAVDLRVDAGPATLKPGHYCGGIELRKGAEVTLEPGVYLLSDGPLDLTAHSSLAGEGVTFVFHGKDGFLNVHAHGDIDVKAPTEGPLEGFVMVEDRASSEASRSFVHGDGSVRIVGTIYLPNHEMRFYGSGALNEDAEQMAIIANNIGFKGDSSSTFMTTINADYAKAGFEQPVARMPVTAALVH
ncbi:MAG TPA: pilus assembly protein [Kaistiaceae bacterium]|nr:pilus assembly protein [Kaistiaceae bacterium]